MKKIFIILNLIMSIVIISGCAGSYNSSLPKHNYQYSKTLYGVFKETELPYVKGAIFLLKKKEPNILENKNYKLEVYSYRTSADLIIYNKNYNKKEIENAILKIKNKIKELKEQQKKIKRYLEKNLIINNYILNNEEIAILRKKFVDRYVKIYPTETGKFTVQWNSKFIKIGWIGFFINKNFISQPFRYENIKNYKFEISVNRLYFVPDTTIILKKDIKYLKKHVYKFDIYIYPDIKTDYLAFKTIHIIKIITSASFETNDNVDDAFLKSVKLYYINGHYYNYFPFMLKFKSDGESKNIIIGSVTRNVCINYNNKNNILLGIKMIVDLPVQKNVVFMKIYHYKLIDLLKKD